MTTQAGATNSNALRCQLATQAGHAGVSPRVVQRLMRHSTLELTGRYTRSRAVDLEGAAAAPPSLRPDLPSPEGQAATGTDGRISERFAHYLPTGGDGTRRTLSVTGENADAFFSAADRRKENPEKPFDVSGRGISQAVLSSGGGTRTPDTRIMIPLL